MEANDRQRKQKMPLGCKIKREMGKQRDINDGETTEKKRPSGNKEGGNQKEENLKLSIVETQLHEWKPRVANWFIKARCQIFADVHLRSISNGCNWWESIFLYLAEDFQLWNCEPVRADSPPPEEKWGRCSMFCCCMNIRPVLLDELEVVKKYLIIYEQVTMICLSLCQE